MPLKDIVVHVDNSSNGRIRLDYAAQLAEIHGAHLNGLYVGAPSANVTGDAREHIGSNLTSWLGDPVGHWEGDTLVVEVTNFNGKDAYRGATDRLKFVERYTRTGPTTLEYVFTIDDPTIWTRPWTAMFTFDRDDDQYELVEYACHEGNYGMTNILSGARSQDAGADSGR